MSIMFLKWWFVFVVHVFLTNPPVYMDGIPYMLDNDKTPSKYCLVIWLMVNSQ